MLGAEFGIKYLSQYNFRGHLVQKWEFFAFFTNSLNLHYYPSAYYAEGYCRWLRLPVCPSVCLSVREQKNRYSSHSSHQISMKLGRIVTNIILQKPVEAEF